MDLLIRGGRVVDPASGVDSVLDVGIRGGRIAAIDRDLTRLVTTGDGTLGSAATHVIDAAGQLVIPGLIDLHMHAFPEVCPLSVGADESCSRSGVTTAVSAGDAGAHTFQAFRRLVIQGSRTRVLAFLHISAIGLAGWPVGEALDLGHLDVASALRAVETNADTIVGIKVRMTEPAITGSNGLEPLRRAKTVATRAGLPLMVHIGSAPAPLEDLLALLRAGDIVTHAFNGLPNGIVENGRVRDCVVDARERGVLFDVGHGSQGFDFAVAEACVREGFWPDTISSDLHSLSSAGPARDLPTTMSKFLLLGMPLAAVVAAATVRPAEVLARQLQLGSLQIGMPADVAVLELVESPTELYDGANQRRTAEVHLECRQTIRGGVPWGLPATHPGTGVWLGDDRYSGSNPGTGS